MIPAQLDYPQQAQFEPAVREITTITNAFPAVVTTSVAHLYSNGMIVRLEIPEGYGITKADGLSGIITVITSDTFSILVDTSFMDPFVVPIRPQLLAQKPQAVPFGEINELLNAAVRNVLLP